MTIHLCLIYISMIAIMLALIQIIRAIKRLNR